MAKLINTELLVCQHLRGPFDIPPPRPSRWRNLLEAVEATGKCRQHDNMNILDRARLLRSRK